MALWRFARNGKPIGWVRGSRAEAARAGQRLADKYGKLTMNPARTPVVGEIWRGIKGDRCRILKVAGSQVTVLQLDSGHRVTSHLADFLATYRPPPARTNPKRKGRKRPLYGGAPRSSGRASRLTVHQDYWIESSTAEEMAHSPEYPYRMVTTGGQRFGLSALDAIRAQKEGLEYRGRKNPSRSKAARSRRAAGRRLRRSTGQGVGGRRVLRALSRGQTRKAQHYALQSKYRYRARHPQVPSPNPGGRKSAVGHYYIDASGASVGPFATKRERDRRVIAEMGTFTDAYLFNLANDADTRAMRDAAKRELVARGIATTRGPVGGRTGIVRRNPTLWSVTATRHGRQVPTFLLNQDVQGFMSEQGAERIAHEVVGEGAHVGVAPWRTIPNPGGRKNARRGAGKGPYNYWRSRAKYAPKARQRTPFEFVVLLTQAADDYHHGRITSEQHRRLNLNAWEQIEAEGERFKSEVLRQLGDIEKGRPKSNQRGRNPRPVLKWSMYAGGTGAWEGAHGYSAHPEIGNYKIDPVTTRYGRRAGYLVRFENVKGALPGGLHQEIGRASSPNQAKRMALEHYMQHASPAANPGRALSVPEKHQLKIARDTLKMSDAGARIMGGPTKAEAREIIYRLTGRWPTEPNRRPKGRKAAKKNPRSQMEKARQQFEKWHEFPPDGPVTRVKAPAKVPQVMARLGELVSVVYKSDKYDGKAKLYEHTTRRPRPVLATDPEGKDVFIVGGKMKVTSDGLVN